MASDTPNGGGGRVVQRRIIKRYSNRKLYDTKGSSYVTLLQIAEMIRAGEEVQIIDNATKEDKTDVTLALIISEELKASPRGVPLGTLIDLIRQRGERFLSHLRETPVGRFLPGEGPEDALSVDASQPGETFVPDQTNNQNSAGEIKRPISSPPGDEENRGRGLRATLEQWQAAVDERIRAALPNFAAFRDLETELSKLTRRVEQLEARLSEQNKSGLEHAPGQERPAEEHRE